MLVTPFVVSVGCVAFPVMRVGRHYKGSFLQENDMSRALRTGKTRAMIDIVLDHLKEGKSITAFEAVELWGELNLRNKISELRRRGWRIFSDEIQNPNGGKYKRYYLDMDNPKDGEDE